MHFVRVDSPVWPMSIKPKILLFLVCVCAVTAYSGQQPYSAGMIAGLQGGSSPDAAKKLLTDLGFTQWRERTLNNSLALATPLADLGVSGTLNLQFYDGHLVFAKFRPDDNEQYWKLLHNKIDGLPETVNQAKQISRDVVLDHESHYEDQGVVTWYVWVYLPVLRDLQKDLHKPSF